MPGGRSVQTHMMWTFAKFGYVERSGVQALEMPYVGGALSMVVLLPREIDGLPDLEGTLNAKTILAWTKKLRRQRVEVHFPRFAMTRYYPLSAALQSMGLRDAFSQKDADFTGVTSAGQLFIDTVVHKAFVEVNEKGTEAAAATGMAKAAGKGGKPPPPPPVFRADHPFVFVIRDMRSGSILFIGRVMNPKE